MPARKLFAPHTSVLASRRQAVICGIDRDGFGTGMRNSSAVQGYSPRSHTLLTPPHRSPPPPRRKLDTSYLAVFLITFFPQECITSVKPDQARKHAVHADTNRASRLFSFGAPVGLRKDWRQSTGENHPCLDYQSCYQLSNCARRLFIPRFPDPIEVMIRAIAMGSESFLCYMALEIVD